MVQRCICVALNEFMAPFRADGTVIQLVDTAEMVVAPNERIAFRKRLLRMEEDGGRYRNLEKHLGQGVTLVLGIELGES